MIPICNFTSHYVKRYILSKTLQSVQYLHTCPVIFCKKTDLKVIHGEGLLSVPTRTAGIIVIGDEILKGQVQDTNSYFVSKVFYNLGIKVKRISIIGDNLDDIVKEIQTASSKYTYVITTGGIGPTHDDITFEAIAMAFDEPLILHPQLVQVCKQFYETIDLSEPVLKLANVPKSAKLTFGYDKVRGRKTLYPNVAVRNVYIFPGVPQLMERLFTAVYDQLFDGGTTHFFLKEIYLTDPETNIAHQLNEIVREFPDVLFGSYPKFFDSYYKVRITIESLNEHETIKAYEKLRTTFSENIIIDYDTEPLENSYDKILRLVKDGNRNHITNAISIVEDCCVKYSTDNICIYFNGEVESTALLHLYYACLKKHNPDKKIMAFYVQESKPTQDLSNYLRETTFRYNMNIETLQGPPSSTIESYIAAHSDRNLIIIGSTKEADDWVQHLTLISQQSKLTVIQPFAGWSRVEVWKFVRSLCLPYCKLYDTHRIR